MADLQRTSKPGIYRRGRSILFVLPFVDGQGKRKQKWVSRGEDGQPFKSLDAADKERTRLRYRRDTGLDIAPEKLTLAAYGARWLAYKKPEIGPHTYLAYQDALKRSNVHIGQVRLDNLKPIHVREMLGGLKDRGYATSSINQTRSVLSRMLNQAVDDELLVRNVAARVKGPKQTKRDFYLPSKPEMARLFTESDRRGIGPLVRLATLTGMRIGELLALTWADIDFDASRLRIRAAKTEAGVRLLSLGPVALRLLKDLREEDGMLRFAGPVFAMKRTHRNRPWTEARQATGLIKLHFHDLRHIHASLLIEQGVDFKVIQERLGHRSIRTTLDLYGHLRAGADAPAALQIEAALDTF